MLKSLDPRINRLSVEARGESSTSKMQMDQLETYEVFVQLKDSRPFNHVGIVHGSSERFAFLFAKEQYSRRLTCNAMWIVKTKNVNTTVTTEDNDSIYKYIQAMELQESEKLLRTYQIFHLLKRGKQHRHIGEVKASDPEPALRLAKKKFDDGSSVYNIWIIEDDDLYKTSAAQKTIWDTLPEKKYREAIDYRGSDMLDRFKTLREATKK